MAGFLFSLGKDKNSLNALKNCIEKGIYSTIIKKPKNGWNDTWKLAQEGTFADYCSMKEGDNVYFFIDRKIYGIGTLTNIEGDCKFLNYPDSNYPKDQNYEKVKASMLLDEGSEDSVDYRFICTFEPNPYFFKEGIDMDELLSSSPHSFKILRAFWKLSFIKFSDEENQAFKNIILRKNVEAIEMNKKENTIDSNYKKYHDIIRQKIAGNNLYKWSISPFLNTINDKDKSLRHEMAIEAAIIYQITNKHKETIEVFGLWDYLSHQVIASPFKPIDYIDKIDIFGYRYIKNEYPTIKDFLIIEIKKGKVTQQDILQLMKYVDWVKNEYAFNDYSMIKAFIVGHDFDSKDKLKTSQIIERKYISGFRPSVSKIWNDVSFVKYKFNETNNLLDFQLLNNGE